MLATAVGTRPVETQGLRGPAQEEADLRPRQQVEREVGPRRGRVDEPGPPLALVLVERAGVGHPRCSAPARRPCRAPRRRRPRHPSVGAGGVTSPRPASSRRANARRSRAACSTSTGTKARTGPVSSEWASRTAASTTSASSCGKCSCSLSRTSARAFISSARSTPQGSGRRGRSRKALRVDLRPASRPGAPASTEPSPEDGDRQQTHVAPFPSKQRRGRRRRATGMT